MIEIKKKKRVSKKSKTAWRKHCDITDVEAYLEDQRLEERLGRFETKPDEELFVLDTQGEDVKDVKPDIKPLSAKQQRRAKLAETPKCFEILLSSSKVPDPNAKRNTVKQVGSKPSDLSKLSVKRQLAKGILQKRVELIKKDKKLAREKRKKAQTVRQIYDKNIWEEKDLEAKGIPETLIDDFISPEAQLHNVPVTKRLRAKPPPPRTVVTRAAVEVPHPGVSYNPSFKEHQELLQEVVQHEEKMMKRQAHLHRVTSGMFSKVTPQEKENQWREEMSAGLPQPHNPATEPEPDEPSDNEYKAVNPPVRNKKKDHKTRRKQKERLLELEKLKRQKIDKKKITDIYKLRKIEASVAKKEERDAEVRVTRTSRRLQHAATALPALNAHRAPVKEPEFVEPARLSGDLRNISGSGEGHAERERDAEVRATRTSRRLQHAATALPALNAHRAPVKEPEFVEPARLSGDLRNISGSGEGHTERERDAEVRVTRTSRRLQHAATALPALNAHRAPVKEPEFVEPARLSGDLRNISGSGEGHTERERDAEVRVTRTSRRLQHAATALPALNAHRAPVKEPEFVEPARLSGDLRNISGSVNLLRDRFESLQRRGALAASKIMMTKRKKLKKYFKPGHKVTDQDVEKFLKRSVAEKQ